MKDDLRASQATTRLHSFKLKNTKGSRESLGLLEEDLLGNWFPRIKFTMLRHLGIQRLLLPWSKGTRYCFN